MYLVVPPGGSIREMRRIELGPAALTIGRSESCEIQIDVPGVDDEHAKISEVALIAIGADCAVGDVPLDPGHRRLVMPGDEIQIGSVVLALEGHDPSMIPPGVDPMGRAQPRALPAPRIRVVEGSNFGDELVMTDENREYVLGRHANCDLVLEDREVSRQHLTLLRRGYSIFVKDLTSTRGSWLGRAAVYTAGVVEWTRPRMLRVGASVLSLELPEEIRRAVPGAQASAPMTPPPRSRGPGSLVHSPPPSPMQQQQMYGHHPAPGSVPPPPVQPQQPAAISWGDGGLSVDPARRLAAFAQQAQQPGFVPQPAQGTGRAEPLPAPSNALKRKAWKKGGPTIGRTSGVLLLALAGLAIAGALFVVFSLLE